MKSKYMVSFLILLLFVPISIAVSQPILDLQGITWDQTSINILIIPSIDESWWNEYYINSTLRAINMWNNAMINFSNINPQFSYISQIRMEYSILPISKPGYDIYIKWQEDYTGTNTLGTSQAIYELPCTIINNTISLGVKQNGKSITEIDMQNIALHELGHSLGLGHSDYPQDIMYPHYELRGTVSSLSSLDLYGVAIVFNWLSRIPYPIDKCPPFSSLSLPFNIEYEFLPIFYSDLPPPKVHPYQIILETFFEYITYNFNIILLVSIIIIIFFLYISIEINKTNHNLSLYIDEYFRNKMLFILVQ